MENPSVNGNLSTTSTDFLRSSFDAINIHLSDLQEEQFLLYYRILVEKNKVMNLTAITNFEDVVLKHFVDSALISFACGFGFSENSYSLIDVGSGAGFPGIPLKILFPDIRIFLLDSLNKRVNFLNDLIGALKLQDISAVHARAEDAAHNPKFREKYDFCVSRAVANLSSLSEYCLPFVKKDGFFISYKSADIDQEVADADHAISLLGGRMKEVKKCTIPNTDISRAFVVVEKKKKTPVCYPRKAGIPAKMPL